MEQKVNEAQLAAHWMPFSANKEFKADPRMLVSADGNYYQDADGRKIFDGLSGLWTCGLGHNIPEIRDAVSHQLSELDLSPGFQFGQPKSFELAERITDFMPDSLNRVFFTNSGSEAVETALKVARAYWAIQGKPHKTKFIGREKGYHGVNFGGMSVGGMPANRKMFGNLVVGVDHLRHTHGIEENRFSKGQPEHGAELADDLIRLCELHDPSTIAAVIVEPLAGSAGVILPPKGYLERLRAICDEHGILLIFDEVITAFGRLGTPFAANFFGVEADIACTAKALANGVIPMGAVFAQDKIYDAFMHGPDNMVEFFHGYTFSGNPMACAAALATLDTYEEEGLLTRGAELSDYWQEAAHSLADLPLVKDVRNMGLIAGIEMEPIEGAPTKRAFAAFMKAYEAGLLIRTTGDTIALSPPLIIEKSHIDFAFGTLRDIIKSLD